METVRIRRDGFAVRYTFQEFMDRYVLSCTAYDGQYLTCSTVILTKKCKPEKSKALLTHITKFS